jgi:NAD(P)-dependent dehydrogenase (short-subunit alcohol dehydrogenase family)
MSSLSGRVIMVTGAGKGVGAAICNELAVYGARLAVVDSDADNARETARRLQGIGADAFAITADPANEHDVVLAMQAVRERHGRLHGLINNASMIAESRGSWFDLEEWDRVMATNLRGSFLLVKYAVPMLKIHGGHVVNIAYGNTAQNTSACAGSWGLLGLTHALRAELHRYNVRLTTVLPGAETARQLETGGNALELGCLLDPVHIAGAVRTVLSQPRHVAVPEITVVPTPEPSLP